MNSPEQSFAEPMYDPREVPEWRDGDFRLRTDGPPPRGRNRWFWPGVSFLILVAIFGGLVTTSVLLTHEVTTTKTVTIGSAPRLILTSPDGDVHVVDGPAGQIQVVMREHVLQGNNHRIPVHFELSPDGNTLTITSNQGQDVGINYFGYNAGVNFTISVPSQTALDIHTDSGDITSQGIDGPMTLTTSSGNVTTGGGSGEITLTSSSGDISASNVSGHLQLSTSSGNIRATNASATSDSTFHTDSGDITYSGTLAPSASFGFDTSSGDVSLTLPGSSSFQIRATTDSGSVDSEFSTVTVLSGDGSGAAAAGLVGSPPYAEISIQVSSGDIHLRAA